MLVRRGLALFGCLLVTATASAQTRPGPVLAFGGDVLYDAPLAYQLRRRAREVGREAAYREVFSDLAPTLAAADLAVVNLEVPITARYRDRTPEEDVPVFRAPEHFLDALRSAGVDAFTIANNHAYDQGLRGLRNTIGAARTRSVPLIGAGDDQRGAARAHVLTVGGARVALAAWTEGTNHRPRSEEGRGPCIAFLRDGTVQESLRAARAGGAQLVVAIFHWIHEDLTRPRPMMREVAREAAEAGADLVIGHGTHVPGSTEVIETSDGRRVRVLYSLGNLLAAMEEPAGELSAREVGVRDAPLARVRTRWRSGRLEVADVEVLHHWITRPVPVAPWLEGGTIAVGRPVSIASELARLAASPCGRSCAHRAAMYRRRVALIDAAMTDLAQLPPDPAEAARLARAEEREARQAAEAEARGAAEQARAEREARQAAARAEREAEQAAQRAEREAAQAAERAEREARADARARAREAQRLARAEARARAREAEREERLARAAAREEAREAARAERLARAEAAPAGGPSRPTASAEPSRAPRVVIPDTDPRLQPFLRGVPFPMEFADGAVGERTVDGAALGRLVALMLEDRGLDCEITGYSTATEAVDHPALGAMRARRLKVLVAGRGPSRSRFVTRGGQAGSGPRAGTGHVVVRLRRRR